MLTLAIADPQPARPLIAILAAASLWLNACSDCSRRTAAPVVGHTIAAPPPLENRVLCEAAAAGTQADRPPAAFSGEVPAARSDSAIHAAQWLFSRDSGAGITATPDTIEAMPLLQALGRSLVSSRFLIFEARFGQGTFGLQRYALVDLDFHKAVLVRNCDEFNALVASLDRGPRSKPDTIAMARAYLVMIGSLQPADVIIDRAGGASPEELQGLEDWFAGHPGLALGSPVFERRGDRSRMRFWTWRRTDGILRRHTIELDAIGRVVEHLEEIFGKRIGKLIKV